MPKKANGAGEDANVPNDAKTKTFSSLESVDELNEAVAKFKTLEHDFHQQAGEMLIEVKAAVKHGRWLEFLDKCEIDARTAQNYMNAARNPKLLDEYGYSKTLMLASLPDGKLKELATDHKLANLSVRQVKALVAEKTEKTPRKQADPTTLSTNKVLEYAGALAMLHVHTALTDKDAFDAAEDNYIELLGLLDGSRFAADLECAIEVVRAEPVGAPRKLKLVA